MTLSPADLPAVRAALLAWFDRAGRDLPGRAMFTAFDLRRGCRGNPVGRGSH